MITGFFLGAAFITKSPSLFFLLLLPSTILVSNWIKNRKDIKVLGHIMVLWAVSAVIAFAVLNILRLGPNFHMIALRNKDYVFGLNEVLIHPLDPFQFHIKELLDWFLRLMPYSIFATSVLGIVTGWRKYKLEVLLLCLWILGPLFVQSEIAKVFTARYILYTIFPFFVLSAVFFERISVMLKGKYLIVMAILISVPALWTDNLLINKPEDSPLPKNERSGYLEAWTSGTGIREVADFIKQEHEKNPGWTIVVGTEGFFGTLPDGLQIYTTKVPNVLVKGVGISISTVDESLIGAKKAKDKVYLVVNSSRLSEKPENMGIKLIAAYPKAIKADGTRESLLLFEVQDEAIKIFDIKNAKNPERS